MPRQARLDAPGILHHVIIRGLRRKASKSVVFPLQRQVVSWVFPPRLFPGLFVEQRVIQYSQLRPIIHVP
jgi:hypothetical protein